MVSSCKGDIREQDSGFLAKIDVSQIQKTNAKPTSEYWARELSENQNLRPFGFLLIVATRFAGAGLIGKARFRVHT